MQLKLPKNSASLIIGPPLSGKKHLLYRFMFESLKNKEPVLFMTTDNSSETIKRELVANKLFYGHYSGILRFVDSYSQREGNNVEPASDTKSISGPLALNEISVVISQFEAEFFKKCSTHTILFDSLSTLLMYSNAQMIGRFLQVLIARVKNAGGSIIFTMEEGMHDQKDMITIEHFMDALVYVKKDKETVLFKVQSAKCSIDWCELDTAI